MGLYRDNKAALVGTEIECPVCHHKFIKRQYSQAFCCGSCKDKFHNRHDGDRHKSGYYKKYDADKPWRQGYALRKWAIGQFGRIPDYILYDTDFLKWVVEDMKESAAGEEEIMPCDLSIEAYYERYTEQ